MSPPSAYAKRTEQALRAVGMYSNGVHRAVMRLPAEFLADVAFMQYGREEAVLRRAAQVAQSDLDRLRRARLQGNGLILGCSNFGCFYTSLLACRDLIDELLLVLDEVPSGALEFKRRLERLSGVRLRLLSVDNQSSVAIARQLLGGGVVATMLDTCSPQSTALVAPFFGRPAASPAGIYHLAVRTDASVLPIFSLRRKQGHTVEIHEPIDHCARREAVEIAAAVNIVVETKIRAAPDQWMMWPALLDRWSIAAQRATLLSTQT